jgi:hypothetical protein
VEGRDSSSFVGVLRLTAFAQDDNVKVQKQIPSLRCGMTNKKATTEILAFGQNDGQEQKQMRGF